MKCIKLVPIPDGYKEFNDARSQSLCCRNIIMGDDQMTPLQNVNFYNNLNQLVKLINLISFHFSFISKVVLLLISNMKSNSTYL